MHGIPWYKSPVYIGIVVNLLYGAFNMAGLADFISVEDLNVYVVNGFGVIAFVAALVAEWKRRKAPQQPIGLTKASARKL